MARNTSTAHVVITMDGKQAVDLMKGLQKQIKDTRKELEEMEQAGVGPDDKQYKKKLDELKAMEKAARQNAAAYIDLQDVVDNLSGQTLNKLTRALKEARKQMNNFTADDPRMKKLIAQYQAIDNQIGKITGQWKRQDGAILSVIKRLSAYVSVYGGFNFITGQLSTMVTRNLEFSDSLADIQKTTGLSAKGVAELSNEINKIDTRTSVDELHKLAYEAGKLGIGSEGVQGVAGFVRAADKISVALGEELGGSEAIKELMKMNDVLGLTQKMGIEKSLMATGSAINLLGQSTTANADYIADFTRRLAGIGAQAHMTIAEIMAFGAAADSTGQELEVAATAMNLFITQLQTHYKTVSQAAGVSEDTIKNLLEMGKTTEAVMIVLRGLSEKGGLSQLGPIMKDLGSEGARMSGVLANFASNLDKVEQALMISNKGFEEAISVTNEYTIKNDNAAAIVEKIANSWEKLFVNVKNTQELKEVAQSFYDLSQSVQNNTLLMTELKVALFLITEAFRLLISMLPSLILLFSFKGLAQGILYVRTLGAELFKLSKDAIAAARGITAAGTAANTAGKAFKGISNTLKSNIFLFAASALATLVMRLTEAKRELSEVEKSARDLNDGFKAFTKESSAAGIEANILFGRLKNLKEGTTERRDLLVKINELYGKYLPSLLSEKSTLEQIKDAQDAVNRSLAQSIAYRTKETALQRVGEQYTNKLAEQLSDLQNIYSAAGSTALGEIDAKKITELAAKYYDMGTSWRDAQNAVWRELYGPKGASRQLIDNKVFIARMDEAQRAVNNYVAHFYNQQRAIEAVNKKYDPLIGAYTPTEETQGPYKITEAEKEAEEKRRQREQLKFAKDEYEAVMSAIEVYYSQQRQVINENYLQQKITTQQREKELTDIQLRELNTRIEARKKLHGDADENWATELGYISQNDIARTDASQRAIANLTGKNLDDIREKLKRFGTGEMDDIWAKLEQDLLKIQSISIDLQQEVEKILLQKDYVGEVQQNYQMQLEKLDLFFTAYEEGIREGYENATEETRMGMRKLANAAAREAMQKLAEMSKSLYTIDINTSEGQQQFRNMLSEQAIFGEQMINLKEEELKALYYKTLEYGDATTEAMKRQREEQLKIAAERFLPQAQSAQQSDAINKATLENYKNAQAVGLATPGMVADQEVLMYKERLEAAMEYYTYLATHGYDTEAQRIKMEEAAAQLSEKMTAQIQEQLQQYKGFFDAFVDLSENFTFNSGEEGLEERQEAFENFVKQMGNLTKKLILNWVKEKIEHALIRNSMVKTQQTTQKKMTDVTVQEQSVEQTLVNEGTKQIAQATIDMGQQVVSAKKQQAVENVSTSATETQANVGLGIAGAAAKTLGSLGWWGIPLIAVITALLNGLLNAAMSKVSALFGGTENVAQATNTKLVTGMLTYDKGNVQSVAAGSSTVNVPADDGRVYRASVSSSLPSGVGVVNAPLATLVNGKPALVGERGPELVVGRETTKAIMQYRPDLLRGLVAFDRHYSNGGRRFTALDSGNVQSFSVAGSTGADAIRAVIADEMAPVMRQVTASIEESAEVNRQLIRRMGNIQARIVRSELVDETVDEIDFRARRRSDPKINRLFNKK